MSSTLCYGTLVCDWRSNSRLGIYPPKSEEDLDALKETLAEMEDSVKDAILMDETDDTVLNSLIKLTLKSISSGRELFPNLFDAPIFYERHFKPWVIEGMSEVEKVNAQKKSEEV